jgi:hypothetical protein
VAEILLRDPTALNERDRSGHSPLHFAIKWTRGMKLLLKLGGKAIVNLPNRYGHIPLAYATQAQCIDTVKLLLEGGSRLSSPEASGATEDLLSDAVNFGDEKLIDVAIDALRNRRKLLESFAQDILPRDLWQRLAPTEGCVLDSSARDVQDALVVVGVEIPPSLSVCRRNSTVYSAHRLSIKTAEKLFQAGFHDIDTVGVDGLTPLMVHGTCCTDTKLVSWLLSKGADLDQQPDVKVNRILHRNTASHYVCCDLGFKWHYKGDVFPSAHWEAAIFSCKPDLCHCACSSQGCLPITMFFKPAMKFERSKKFDVKLLDELCNTDYITRPVAMEILRILTFDTLELRHTCCAMQNTLGIVKRYEDDAEISEIHDEERGTITKLEELMDEFFAKYEELGMPLVSFVEEYWQRRMDEVLGALENETLQDDEIAKIRELGVVLKLEETDARYGADSIVHPVTSWEISSNT